jgi:hypothetical protein
MTAQAFFELAMLAGGQGGLVTAAQAGRIGVTGPQLDHFAGLGLLVELDRGVYEICGSTLAPRFGYPYAAWLALRPDRFGAERGLDAVLSHGSAARLLGLGAVGAPLTTFTAAAAPQGGWQTSGTVEVRQARLTRDDVALVGGVPVTTPHRTILDLVRDHADHGEIRGALTDAVRRDLVDLAAIHADLVPLSEHHEFPAAGPEFAGYFLPTLDVRGLSARNLRAFTTLVLPDRVAEVAGSLAAAIPDPPPGMVREHLARDLAAEVVGRSERV